MTDPNPAPVVTDEEKADAAELMLRGKGCHNCNFGGRTSDGSPWCLFTAREDLGVCSRWMDSRAATWASQYINSEDFDANDP